MHELISGVDDAGHHHFSADVGGDQVRDLPQVRDLRYTGTMAGAPTSTVVNGSARAPRRVLVVGATGRLGGRAVRYRGGRVGAAAAAGEQASRRTDGPSLVLPRRDWARR